MEPPNLPVRRVRRSRRSVLWATTCQKKLHSRRSLQTNCCWRQLGTWIENEQVGRAGFNRIRNQKEI